VEFEGSLARALPGDRHETFDFHARGARARRGELRGGPTQWHFYLQIPGMWRLMFPIAPDVSDEAATERDFARRTLASIQPDVTDDDIVHVTLYRVHQRVAKRFRMGAPSWFGDAAHINNPLGGMGMNGGIMTPSQLSPVTAGAGLARRGRRRRARPL